MIGLNGDKANYSPIPTKRPSNRHLPVKLVKLRKKSPFEKKTAGIGRQSWDKAILVGGWTNPSEKYARLNWIIST